MRGARFFRQVFAAQIVARVAREWNAGIAALLRAVVHESVLADVEITRPGAAAPVVGQAPGNVVLKRVDAGKAALFERLHFVIDAALFLAQRLQLPAAVVNDSDRRSESEFYGALADHEGILRMGNAAAHDRIDVHMKVGVLGQQLQLAIENFQAFLRDLVRIDVVDRNLQPLQSGAIQPLDTLGDQKVPIGDQSGDHAVGADAADQVIELGMHQRLAA